MKTARLFILALLTATIVGHAQPITNSGWIDATTLTRTAPTIPDFQALQSMQSFSGQSFSLLSSPHEPSTPIAEAITSDIQALARGLENDPLRIFAYVHDHIRYVHYFGSKKGAQLTLLEKSGNDFDQSALLVALLRAAGHTNVTYQFGWAWFPYDNPDSSHRDLHHWWQLNLENTSWTATANHLASLTLTRGFPMYGANPTSSYFGFQHVWVNLTIGATTYPLDPAFKVSEYSNGINIPAAMGFSSNAVWNAAAGTETANYVTNLNEAALRSTLTGFTTNLLNYFQSNYPNAYPLTILGGWVVQSYTDDELPQQLVFTTDDMGGQSPIQTWVNQPTNLMSKLTLTFAGTNHQWMMPQLAGDRITLTFATNGLAQLWQEDTLLKQAFTTNLNNTTPVGIAVDHPVGYWNLTNNTFVDTGDYDQNTSAICYQRTNASTYNLPYAFEPDWGWLQKRQQRLADYRLQGLSANSREVVSETLNVIGLSWMMQTAAIEDIIASQFLILPQNMHRLGRVGQEGGRGHFTDIYMQLSGQQSATGSDSVSQASVSRHFAVKGYFSSALEHGVIEQLQPTNIQAASTIKMLQVANTNKQAVYLGWYGNWNTGFIVRNKLVNYDASTLSGFDFLVSLGYFLMLPQNGSNQVVSGVGNWGGYGNLVTDSVTLGMFISGNYNGGFSATPGGADSSYIDQSGQRQPDAFSSTPYGTPNPTDADPVNMADGTFEFENTDLSIGQAEPRGLRFARYYNGTRRHSNPAGMANGWIHNFFANAAEISAPEAGLGSTTPAQMAPILVAALSDISIHNPFAASTKNWMMTALIAKWGVDQLTRNGVSVTLGKDSLQFVRQPNGVFTPPANCTFTLLQTNSTYWLQERHGNTFKFSASGGLTNIVDQYGQQLTLTYNASNWVSQVKDWKNRTLTFNYSGTPQRLTSVVDDLGRTVTLGYATTYNSQGDLTSVTDPENKTSRFGYDANHQITAVSNALNQLVVTNVYDSMGHVTRQYTEGNTNKAWDIFWSGWETVVKDPAGGKRRYYYDDKRRLITTQDALGNGNFTIYDGQNHTVLTLSALFDISTFGYDGRHNLTMAVDPLNFTNRFVYDGQDNLTYTVDARGNTNRFGYNSKFQLTGTTNAAGDWVSMGYSATDGTLTSRTDPVGTTSYGYDSYGQLNLTTYPGGLGNEGLVNSSLGDVLSRTNTRGFVTSFQYNQRRELTNTVAPTNLTAKVTYDAVGNVFSVTDPRGFTASNTWSATRKLLATRLPATPQGVPVITNVYDNRDWLSRTFNPLQQATVFTNDAAQRLISVTDPLQRTVRFGYDALGRKTATTNAANEVTRQEWNARSELTQVTTPAVTTIKRGYDASGNQTTLTNRNGKKWQFQYDAANRLTNTITPLNRQTAVTYDNRSLVRTVREPSTQTTSNFYDARGRLTNSSDAVAIRSFVYDGNNNVTNIVENGKTNAWSFDAYDRVSTYRDADGNLIQYRYDASGNLTNLIYPGNRTVTYAYDSLNRLTNVTDWANRQTAISYDLVGRATSISRPNGTVRINSYDAAGQTTNIWERTGAGLPIALFRLNWNNAARMQWDFTAPLPHAYTPATRTMTFDDDNRIALFNGNSVGYDVDGNLTNGPLTNNTFSSYTYDARNRLLSVGGVSSGYDPAGNRTTVTNGASVTRLVVNPNAPLSQVLMRIKGGTTNYYIYGVGLQYEITETATTTNTLTYHFDFRGSTVALTDDNGNVTDRIEYSPYATTTYRSGTNDTPFLYNGRYGVQTDVNGLLYMRARFYNPYLCRFLSADPAGFSGGLNFYAYADGNPVTMIDPFGLGADSADGTSSPLLRPQTPVGGYVDAFGNWHPTFCYSCHDPTDPAAKFYKDQSTLANLLDWKVIAYQQALGAMLSFGFGAIAEDMTAMQSMRQLQQVASLRQYTEADVLAAMARLGSRGIVTTEAQSSIDPNQVIRIAQAMNSGAFKNALMERPVIMDSTTQAILAGHHRIIASEMTGFNLTVNSVPASVSSTVPLSSVPVGVGRVNPPIITPP